MNGLDPPEGFDDSGKGQDPRKDSDLVRQRPSAGEPTSVRPAGVNPHRGMPRGGRPAEDSQSIKQESIFADAPPRPRPISGMYGAAGGREGTQQLREQGPAGREHSPVEERSWTGSRPNSHAATPAPERPMTPGGVQSAVYTRPAGLDPHPPSEPFARSNRGIAPGQEDSLGRADTTAPGQGNVGGRRPWRSTSDFQSAYGVVQTRADDVTPIHGTENPLAGFRPAAPTPTHASTPPMSPPAYGTLASDREQHPANQSLSRHAMLTPAAQHALNYAAGHPPVATAAPAMPGRPAAQASLDELRTNLSGWTSFTPELTADLPVLAQAANTVQFRKDAMIYHADDKADTLFVLIDGMVRLEGHPARGKVPLEPVRPGDFFGECAAIPDQEHVVSAVASMDSRVLRLTTTQLEKLGDGVSLPGRLAHIAATTQARRVALLLGEITKAVEAVYPPPPPVAPSSERPIIRRFFGREGRS